MTKEEADRLPALPGLAHIPGWISISVPSSHGWRVFHQRPGKNFMNTPYEETEHEAIEASNAMVKAYKEWKCKK